MTSSPDASGQFMDRKRPERDADRVKAAFLSLISHELRTPLSSVLGYAELLASEESGPLNVDQRRFVDAVERNANRLMSLVGDLLLVTEIEAGRLRLSRESVDLAALAEEAVAAAEPAARAKGVDLTLALRAARPTMVGDRARLGQVIDYLLSNAIKFTPAGGSIAVTLGLAGERTYLEFRDTGVGIPAGDRDRVFARFHRSGWAAENAAQGAGLGLSITKALVEAHGGTIGFVSVEGGRTTFRVELPVGGER